MKKYFVQIKIYSLLLALIFFTSCNGQVKTSLQTDSVRQPQTIPIGQPKLIKNHFTDQYQAAGDNVHCGLQDKAGNLWFGTTGDGVYRYDGKSFTNYTEKDGLNHNSVWCIMEDRAGNIWFGTGNGICRYDGNNFTNIPIPVSYGGNMKTFNLPVNDPSMKNAVWSVMQDRKGTLWFGANEGVYCYDGKTFTRFLDNDSIINKNGLHLKRVEALLEDKSGNIWFASWDNEGICRFDGKSLTDFKPYGHVVTRRILEDENGNLWFGFRPWGVCLYDGKTFTDITGKEKKLGMPLLKDKAGNIWFGGVDTENGQKAGTGGMWCYDGKSFKNFNAKDSSINNSVWCIVEDKAGNLWVGTRNTGLYRYDGKAFTNFTE